MPWWIDKAPLSPLPSTLWDIGIAQRFILQIVAGFLALDTRLLTPIKRPQNLPLISSPSVRSAA